MLDVENLPAFAPGSSGQHLPCGMGTDSFLVQRCSSDALHSLREIYRAGKSTRWEKNYTQTKTKM
jgi:hypothetical protein